MSKAKWKAIEDLHAELYTKITDDLNARIKRGEFPSSVAVGAIALLAFGFIHVAVDFCEKTGNSLEPLYTSFEGVARHMQEVDPKGCRVVQKTVLKNDDIPGGEMIH